MAFSLGLTAAKYHDRQSNSFILADIAKRNVALQSSEVVFQALQRESSLFVQDIEPTLITGWVISAS